MLTDHEKQLISTINEQTELLISKNASDSTIINTLIDFIPDILCLLNTNEAEFESLIESKLGFKHFTSLVVNLL